MKTTSKLMSYSASVIDNQILYQRRQQDQKSILDIKKNGEIH
jgi:hypothetical protein